MTLLEGQTLFVFMDIISDCPKVKLTVTLLYYPGDRKAKSDWAIFVEPLLTFVASKFVLIHMFR